MNSVIHVHIAVAIPVMINARVPKNMSFVLLVQRATTSKIVNATNVTSISVPVSVNMTAQDAFLAITVAVIIVATGARATV